MIAEAVANTSSDNIVLALIAVIATSVGALVFVIRAAATVSKDTNQQVSEVNNAVNNIGPGEHRLYDKVDHISRELASVTATLNSVSQELRDHRTNWEKFNASWGSLPPEMDTAADLAVVIEHIRDDVKRVREELKNHVEWEMKQKY